MPFQVNRRHERATRPRTLDLLLQQLVAILVEQKLLHARITGELRIVNFFQTRAAFRFLPQRLIEIDRPRRQLAHAAGISDHMRGQLTLGVISAVQGIENHATR